MAPIYLSARLGDYQRIRHSRPAVVGLVTILVALSLGSGPGPVRAQDASEPSLTLSSFECSAELPTDGSPIAAAECASESDRAFILSGPDNQRVDLRTSPGPDAGGGEVRRAEWTVDAGDETVSGGSWSLREFDPDPDAADVIACLKIVGAKFLPVSLDYRDDRSVRLDWTPAQRIGPNVIAGEYLECSWYSAPPLPTEERPGLLMIKNAVGSDPSDADLVVVEPDGEPQGFTNTEAGDVSQATFTVTNDDSGEEFEIRSSDSGGNLTITFALSPGEYTIDSRATGQSSSFALDEGEAVLVLNTLAERPTGDDDLPSIAIDPTPIVIDLQPDPTVEATATPAPLPTVDGPVGAGEAQTFEFSASDWNGAYPDVVTAVYGRDCVALYGRNSQFPSARLTFTAAEAGNGQSELVLIGLDDEWAGQNPMVITVNGEVVFQGENGFNSWDPGSSTVAWSRFAVPFASELIVAGENEIVVTNLAEAANFGTPPYILLADAAVRVNPSGGR